MSIPIPVNDFKYRGKQEKNLDGAKWITNIDGYDIYNSMVNQLYYSVFNPDDNLYYTFEYVGTGEVSLQDLIKTFKWIISNPIEQ